MSIVEPIRPANDIERAVAMLTVDHQLITLAQATKVITEMRRNERSPGEILADMLPEAAMLKAISADMGIRFYDLYSTNSEFLPDEEVMERCDMSFLKRYNALPLVDTAGRVVVAVANPSDVEMVDYLRSRYADGFALVLSPRGQIQNRLTYFAASESSIAGLQDMTTLEALRQNTPTVREVVIGRSPVQEWVDRTLAKAVSENASDVHFMFNADKTLLLRFRVDGILMIQRVPAGVRPMEAIGALIARCSTMDSANYTEPQDGTFSFDAEGRQIDARVALLPQLHGPTMVIRLLDSLNMGARLDEMGFAPAHLVTIREAMSMSQGTVLAVGPTGAGKSTTLYGMLREVNATAKHVQTVENPVEYRTPLIGQTEIRHGLGERSLTFARALRQILRMDPDVILVGEIRDTETAQVAMQAAITGHLVLSTLHANSAVAAFPRLVNMGVPTYLVAEAVNLVISQRLLRRVHECALVSAPTPDEVATLTSLGLVVPDRVAHPVGCPTCRGTGYRGRLATAEVINVDRELRAAAARQATATELDDLVRATGFVPILHDGYRHVVELHTTVAELARVLGGESGEM